MAPHEFGPYLLVEQIAVGGMAQIYLAKMQGIAGFEKFLALKLLHPTYANDEQFIEMLIEEAKIAVRLNHVNIAQVFDLGRVDDRYFIAMEFVDGADLFKIMRRLTERDIDVPIDVATFIGQELCTGLDYAHRQRDSDGKPLDIIHRDISPQNILVSQAGEVKIVDFGIAKATSRSVATQAGVIKGKYFYMSPEQAWGDPVDQRSDIFSAGIILYEVLTGQMLYLEEDMQRLLEMVRKADIAPPTTRRPEIPATLEKIVMKALAKKPNQRWQNANEFQQALTNFLFSYASDFTPDRVTTLVEQALSDDPAPPQDSAGAEEIEEIQEISISEVLEETEAGHEDPPARDVGTQTQQLSVSDLMSRDDFRAVEEASVIFRLDELEEVDEDLGEPTVVSGPPHLLGMAEAPRHLSDEDSPDSGAWEEDTGAPTMVTHHPEFHPPVMDAEVIVPAGKTGDQTLVKPDGVAGAGRPPNVPLPPAKPPTPAPVPDCNGPTNEQWRPLPQQTPSWPQNYTQPRSLQQVLDSVSSPAPRPAPPPPASYPSPSAPPAPPAAPATPAGVASPGIPAPSPPAGATGGIPAATNLAAATAAPGNWPTGPQKPLAPGWSKATLDGSLPGSVLGAADWPAQANARSRRLVRLVVVAGLVIVGCIAGILAISLWPEEDPAVIEVMSVPVGAEVWIDGAKAPRKTRVAVPVDDPKRPHKLVVRMPKFQDWVKEITFPENQRKVEALAVLQPLYGRLKVISNPNHAEVYLNSEHKGTTPTTIEGLSLSEEINLELRKRGFRPETRTLGWEGRRFRHVLITLKRSR